MLARLAWRMPHEAAIDGCLKSGDVFEGAEREDRVLNIRCGGSVLKKPKVAPTDNHLTNGLRTSDFRTAIIGVTDLWRSEERRVGKECRSRGSPDHLKKKNKK